MSIDNKFLEMQMAYEEKTTELEAKLSEKEKENEKLKAVVDAIDKLKQFSVNMEEYCLVDRKNADKIFCDNQDKINFAIEKLEKVKEKIQECRESLIQYDAISGSIMVDAFLCDCKNYIDNQIEELTHQHEDKGE